MDNSNLAAALSDPDETVRTFAAEDAGEANHEEDIGPIVERLLLEQRQVVREALVGALLRMTSAQVCVLVAPLLRNEDAFIRNAAVRVLRGRVDQALDVLEPMMADANVDVQKFIVDILAASPHASSTALLLRCLDTPDVNVRIAAVEALGDRRARSAVAKIVEITESAQEPMLIAAALTALESLADEDAYAPLRRRFPRLSEVPQELALPLLQLHAKIAPEAAVDEVVLEAVRQAEIFTSDAADTLEAVQERFGFRRLPERAWEPLARIATESPKPTDRFRLLKWLGKLSDEPRMPGLLIASLGDQHPLVRRGAVLGLGQTGRDEAQAALSSRLGSEPDPEVRAAIEQSLRRLSGDV